MVREHDTSARTTGSLPALLLALVALPLACATSQPKGPDAFARRASFDFNCPAEELDFAPIKESSPRTYGVRGCNRRSTYTESCQRVYDYGPAFYRDRCVWVLDGPIQVDQQAPVPVQPPAPAPPSPPAPPAPSAS